jgi:hypothetical protein
MKITKENIQFIDNYLTKSEVIYDDLKLELIDHISSAVQDKMDEEKIEFYDAFKNYMVDNKKDILKTGKVNQPFEFKSSFFAFLKFCAKKEIMLFSFIASYLMFKNYEMLFLNNELQSFFYSLMIVAAFSFLWFVVFKLVLKKQFYVLEKNFILFNIILQLFNFSNSFDNSNSLFSISRNILFPVICALFIFYMVYSTFIFYSKNKKLYETN